MSVRYGFNRRAYHYDLAQVTLNVAGTGTLLITFDVPYLDANYAAVIIPPLACNGTFTAGGKTTTTFTITVTTASDLASQVIEVGYFTHQLL